MKNAMCDVCVNDYGKRMISTLMGERTDAIVGPLREMLEERAEKVWMYLNAGGEFHFVLPHNQPLAHDVTGPNSALTGGQ